MEYVLLIVIGLMWYERKGVQKAHQEREDRLSYQIDELQEVVEDIQGANDWDDDYHKTQCFAPDDLAFNSEGPVNFRWTRRK